MINTAYNYKKILSCNDIEQELSDTSATASSNPYIVLHQAVDFKGSTAVVNWKRKNTFKSL